MEINGEEFKLICKFKDNKDFENDTKQYNKFVLTKPVYQLSTGTKAGVAQIYYNKIVLTGLGINFLYVLNTRGEADIINSFIAYIDEDNNQDVCVEKVLHNKTNEMYYCVYLNGCDRVLKFRIIN